MNDDNDDEHKDNDDSNKSNRKQKKGKKHKKHRTCIGGDAPASIVLTLKVAACYGALSTVQRCFVVMNKVTEKIKHDNDNTNELDFSDAFVIETVT